MSIVYNKASCSLQERKITVNKFELVAAIGRIGRVSRQVAIFCLYLEPRLTASDLQKIRDILSDEILAVKVALKDPIVIIGGDMNRKEISSAFNNFADIKHVV